MLGTNIISHILKIIAISVSALALTSCYLKLSATNSASSGSQLEPPGLLLIKVDGVPMGISHATNIILVRLFLGKILANISINMGICHY